MSGQAYYIEPVERALRHFVEDFRNIAASTSGQPRLDALRGPFEELLHDPSWLSAEFLKAVPDEVATWAVYRSHEPDLCIFSMVVPPGARTQVHNHLTDGWVACIQGQQTELKFLREDDASTSGTARLVKVAEERIENGAITPIQHPGNDIHQITTTSSEPSVSLHVLCNDLGSVRRQAFDLEAGTVRDFVSGYTNVDGTSAIGR